MAETEPRYVYGAIRPTAGRGEGTPVGTEPLLPADVVEVSAGIGISDYTAEGVEEAIGRYWDCVDNVISRGAQSTELEGVPISSQLGRARVLQLLQETERRTGRFADSTNEALIAALQRLGARRIAIASRWPDQLNRAMSAYFEDAGLDVLAVTSANQWAAESFSMSVEKGIVLAMRLGREAMRRAPNAEALLLPGGTWRSLAVVPILEEDFDRPVLTNRIAVAWRLMSRGVAPPVQGWGRLLEHPTAAA
jgi:arylmalonate decarboxylase